jgi:hypothetical protein
VESKTYSITVPHAGSLGVGPGAVDPISGAFHLSASDVSISVAARARLVCRVVIIRVSLRLVKVGRLVRSGA